MAAVASAVNYRVADSKRLALQPYRFRFDIDRRAYIYRRRSFSLSLSLAEGELFSVLFRTIGFAIIKPGITSRSLEEKQNDRIDADY